jgi:ribosomal-protein-alanine acetyltransferase
MSQIRPLTAAAIDAVLAVAAESPEAASWNRATYESILANPATACCRVAEAEDQIVGFACFRIVDREAELLNLAVLASFRRRGIGSRLLAQVLEEAGQRGAARIFLEVRDSNAEALRLYQRHGFERTGRRAGYYTNPSADALVLSRLLAQ